MYLCAQNRPHVKSSIPLVRIARRVSVLVYSMFLQRTRLEGHLASTEERWSQEKKARRFRRSKVGGTGCGAEIF
jgi:hypothetical protein